MKLGIIMIGLMAVAFPLTVLAQQESDVDFVDPADADLFREFNPDGQKYKFARHFITSLSYYDRVFRRLRDDDPKHKEGIHELEAILGYVDNLTLDNTELRIAKNYLTRYLNSENKLILKAANESIYIYQRLIEINKEEQRLWRLLYGAKTTGSSSYTEQQFGREQRSLALKRKNISQGLIEVAILFRKILLTQEGGEDGTQLAITEDQRQRLIERLDSFAQENLDWGLAPGQSIVEACVASIREVLEDPVWFAIDE